MVHFELLGRDLERILRDTLLFLGLEVDEGRLKVIDDIFQWISETLPIALISDLRCSLCNIPVHCG